MKICNKCEDVFVTIVDGVFSGSEICPTCLNTTYKTNKKHFYKRVINSIKTYYNKCFPVRKTKEKK